MTGNCATLVIGQRDGKYVHKCQLCRTEYLSKYENPAMFKAMCRVKARPEHVTQNLPTEIIEAIEPELQSRGMLLGDAVAAMTTAIGIPPCGGCGKRKEWLNKAHQWVRSFFTEHDPQADGPR